MVNSDYMNREECLEAIALSCKITIDQLEKKLLEKDENLTRWKDLLLFVKIQLGEDKNHE